MTLKARQDLTATAAEIKSSEGAVTLAAGRDVQLLAGEARQVIEEMSQKKKSGFLKKKVTTTYSKTDETVAVATTVSGDTVAIMAGQDLLVKGSNVVSDAGTSLVAGGDVTIEGVTQTLNSENFSKTVKSGLMGGGGIGFTIGKQSLEQTKKNTELTSAGSTVASVQGDVSIVAGEAYKQVGSTVSAPAGDVSVLAKSIDIEEARNQSVQNSETRFKQSGLTVSLSVPGVDTALGAIKAGEHVTQTEDDRMKALAAATAISKANQALEEIKKFDAMKAADQKQSVRVSISLGSSQSKSSQHNEADQAVGSSLLAGGALSLVATGADKDSNVTVRGSTLTGQDVLLKADNAINLIAARNTSEQHSKDSSSSASVGVGFSLGAENRFGVTVSGSVSKGNSDGIDTSYTTTKVNGGSSVTLQSGGDTALQGAVVTAPKVTADVGGSLKIESLQDTAKFDSKSTSAGGSATFGYGAGGSANFSQSKVNADYAAVGEQAGIRAGDEGFQVSVKGQTDLKGGAITSSQAAIDAGKNSLSTGTLTASDIENRSQYSASAVTVSAGTSGGMAGAYKDSGDERSTTKSTISAGSTTITGGDAASQSTLDKLDRGATDDATAGTLAQGWDGQKLAQQAKVNAQIVAEFGAQAAKEVGDYAASRTKTFELAQIQKQSLDEALLKENLSDSERASLRQQLSAVERVVSAEQSNYDAWREGGSARVALHTLIGGLTGDLAGALGAAGSAIAAPALDSFQKSVKDQLVAAGMESESKDKQPTLADGLSKLAAGLLSGAGGSFAGWAGGAAALNQDMNNRQLHPSEEAWIKSKAKEFAEANKISEEEAKRQLTQQALKEIDFGWRSVLSDGDNAAAKSFLATAKSTFENDLGTQQQLFTVSGTQLTRMEMFMPEADLDFYKRYAQPGVTRDWKTGFRKESIDLAKDKANEVVEGSKAVGKAFVDDPVSTSVNLAKGIVGALTELPSTIKEGVLDSGKALGEGAVVALDKDLTDRMNALYGTDVGALQKSVLTVRAIAAVVGAAGVAKTATELGEKVLAKGGKEAIEKAGAKAEGAAAKDAAKLENAPDKEAVKIDGSAFKEGPHTETAQTKPAPSSDVSASKDAAPHGQMPDSSGTDGASKAQKPVSAEPAQTDVTDSPSKGHLSEGDGASLADNGKSPTEVAPSCAAPPQCFVAGTVIHTVDGPKAIETFVGGELVLSRHEHTGEPGVRPVVATVATKDQPIYEVVIEDARGNTETLHTTSEHPFWVVARAEEAGEDDLGIRESQWVRAS